ncbi:Protease KEX1 [Cladobotryum mycophilum]|uniref:Protease KEX1 n=1 Tax=Cladobotryum mycophilum TaxID=491253 RepID=A0ABR0S7X5_9HYPO
MRTFRCLVVLSVGLLLIANAVGASLHTRAYETHDFYVLHLGRDASPAQIAQELGVEHVSPVGELSKHHIFFATKERRVGLETLLKHEDIQWGTKLGIGSRLQKRIPPPPARGLPKSEAEAAAIVLGQPSRNAVQTQEQVASALGISDPTFRYQWHLLNTVQPGNDLNVTGVWLQGVFGEGVTTAIIDDGLDIDSLDLKPNYYANGSYDFNDKMPEPRPRLIDDHHGTLCAAEIAAARNDICGVGVAYRSRVSGIRMLSGDVDDIDQATAINYDYQNNDIYSCSWGPEDDGRTMKAPGVLVRRAIVNGAQQGRGGKGSIFVFSAGNGASQDDNCNFDGYTNSIYSITVGAIDRTGTHARYSESCSAQLVVTFSSGSGDGIYTTDNGDRCTSLASGTSAAGPLIAGTIALALSVRPELTWRDVQYLMIESAIPVHTSDGSWQVGVGSDRMYSHDWGYGKVDAYALVQKAREWKLVQPQAWLHSPWQEVHQGQIPEGYEGLASYFMVSRDMLRQANLARLEHVTVTINVNHTRRGDLSVVLVSPEGILSRLSTPRLPDDAVTGYVDWEFMSVAHW